jgi:hypothetical protein
MIKNEIIIPPWIDRHNFVCDNDMHHGKARLVLISLRGFIQLTARPVTYSPVCMYRSGHDLIIDCCEVCKITQNSLKNRSADLQTGTCYTLAHSFYVPRLPHLDCQKESDCLWTRLELTPSSDLSDVGIFALTVSIFSVLKRTSVTVNFVKWLDNLLILFNLLISVFPSISFSI